MNFLKRMTVLLVVTSVMFVGCSLLLFVLQVMDFGATVDFWALVYHDYNLRMIVGGTAGVLLVVNYVLFTVYSVNIRRDKIIAFDNPAGRVSVSLSAMEEMVRRLLSKKQDVKDSRVSIGATRKGLDVRVRLTILSDVNIPGLTSRVQDSVRKKINDMIGLEEKINISIFVGRILAPELQGAEKTDLAAENEAMEQNVPFHGYRG